MIYHYRNRTLFQALDSRPFLKKVFRFCITGKDFHSLCSKCRIEGGRGGSGEEARKGLKFKSGFEQRGPGST